MAEIDSERRSDGADVVRLDERRYLPRHHQGDPSAFAELLQRFRAPVFGYLVRCGIDRAACDDLFQEVFLKIHSASASYEPDRPLKPWLFAIVVNTVRSHYRRERVRKLILEEAPPETPSAEPAPDTQVDALETATALDRALDLLTFAEREVVLLVSVEALAMKDVAALLDMPLSTVKTHLHRARATLSRALSRREAQLRREVSP